MPCSRWTDPVEAALHEVGCCQCALYTPRPPQKQLSIEEAEHLLGLFGHRLDLLPNGLYVAVDDARGLQTPRGSSIDTAHSAQDLAGLVVRARCGCRLAGPTTIAEAEATLAALGFELKTRIHPIHGREFWATSQALATSTCQWSYVKDVITAARSILLVSGYDARQPDIPEILAELPRDLDPPLRRARKPDPPVRRGRPVPLDERAHQLGLDLD